MGYAARVGLAAAAISGAAFLLWWMFGRTTASGPEHLSTAAGYVGKPGGTVALTVSGGTPGNPVSLQGTTVGNFGACGAPNGVVVTSGSFDPGGSWTAYVTVPSSAPPGGSECLAFRDSVTGNYVTTSLAW